MSASDKPGSPRHVVTDEVLCTIPSPAGDVAVHRRTSRPPRPRGAATQELEVDWYVQRADKAPVPVHYLLAEDAATGNKAARAEVLELVK